MPLLTHSDPDGDSLEQSVSTTDTPGPSSDNLIHEQSTEPSDRDSLRSSFEDYASIRSMSPEKPGHSDDIDRFALQNNVLFTDNIVHEQTVEPSDRDSLRSSFDDYASIRSISLDKPDDSEQLDFNPEVRPEQITDKLLPNDEQCMQKNTLEVINLVKMI